MIFFTLLTIVCAAATFICYYKSDFVSMGLGLLFTAGLGIKAIYEIIHDEESKRRK